MRFFCAEMHLHIAGWDRYGEPSQYKGGIEYQKIGRVMRAMEETRLSEMRVSTSTCGSHATETVSNSKDGNTLKEPEHGYVGGSWEWKRIDNCVSYGDAVQEKNARGRPTT